MRRTFVAIGMVLGWAAAGIGCNAILGIEKKELGTGASDAGAFALSLAVPNLRVIRGQSASVVVDVQRLGGFGGTVVALVSGLPRGLSVDPLTFSPAQPTATLVVHATDTADLGGASLSIIGVSENISLNPVVLGLIVQDAPGTPDVTFNVSGHISPAMTTVNAGVGPGGVKVQADGSVVVCGHGKTETTDSSVMLARLTAAGALDATFGVGGIVMTSRAGSSADACYAMFLRPSGGIVFVGADTAAGLGHQDMMAARISAGGNPSADFDQDGYVTTTFDTLDSSAYAVVAGDSDRVIVGGLGHGGPAFVRYTRNGLPDPTFGAAGTGIVTLGPEGGIVRSLAQQSTGNLVAAVESSMFRVLRLTPAGMLDSSFGDGGIASVDVGGQGSKAAAVLVQSDDAIVVVGTATGDDGSNDIALTRLTKDGKLDPSFAAGGTGVAAFGDSIVSSAALQLDGAIVVAGQTRTDAGKAFSVVRFSAAGSVDATFGPGGRQTFAPGGMAQGIAVDTLGRIVVAGVNGDAIDSGIVIYRLWP